ncbi:MAG: response regulator transcription factor [Eubacteriales bacterium]|jgi:two-component system alkaline phosphatase synthesis response regulator PhoP|nr:response regulator transcription factor [Eubacteriales bacterium]
MIYYVEDDANIRELVIYTLNQTGLAAKGFSDAAAFFAASTEEKPSLILLDIMLPGEDGLTILRRIRANASTTSIPVMMITAKATEFDKVSGLDLGADDYIAKPFGMAELVARVKALLRRSGLKTSAERLTHGELVVDIAKHTVTVGGQNVILTYKEFSLLACLMENAGRAYTREQLLETVWGYDYEGGTRTVDVHVQTLRTKLGSSGRYVETVRGVGYRFGE